jgi:hypothetical protein
MKDEKQIRACEEELFNGNMTDEEILERCLKRGLTREEADKMLKEHKEALDRMAGEGNPWG